MLVLLILMPPSRLPRPTRGCCCDWSVSFGCSSACNQAEEDSGDDQQAHQTGRAQRTEAQPFSAAQNQTVVHVTLLAQHRSTALVGTGVATRG